MIDQRLTAITDCLYRVATKALIVRDGKLLISKEGKGKFAELNLHGLPGGGLDYGESFHEGLIRELREEMNLEISPAQVSEQPVKTSFGILADGKFTGNKNVPTIIFYFPVSLAENQIPTEAENGFEWADVKELEEVSFVSQTGPDREFLIEYLKNKKFQDN